MQYIIAIIQILQQKHILKYRISMGNKLKQISILTKTAHTQIGSISICPNCEKQFPPTTTYQNFDQHVTHCLEHFRPTDQQRLRMQRRKRSKDSTGSHGSVNSDPEIDGADHDYVSIEIYVKKYDSQQEQTKMQQLSQLQKNKKQNKKPPHSDQFSNANSYRRYKWIKSHLTYSQSLLSSLSQSQISKQTSAYKILWFYQKLQQNRITWKQGSQQLAFNSNSIVQDSLILTKLNLYKQLKITVVNDIVHDAGGLLREWAIILLKQLIQKYGLFIYNGNGYYVINSKFNSNEELDRCVWSANQENKTSTKLKMQQQQLKQLNIHNNSPSLSNYKQPITQSPPPVPYIPQLYSDLSYDLQQQQYQYQIYQQYYKTNMLTNTGTFKYEQGNQYYYTKYINKQSNYKNIQIDKITYRDLYQLFGCLLAKIVIDKVTIPVHFDYGFLNNLINAAGVDLAKNSKNSHMSDKNTSIQSAIKILQTYDKQISLSLSYMHHLYLKLVQSKTNPQSQSYIKAMQQLQSLCLTFSIPATQYSPQYQLVKQGKHLQVKCAQTLQQFMYKYCQYYMSILHKSQINIINKQFYRIVKAQAFHKLFQCDQLQLILNGIDGENINVKDWQEGTTYKQPYNAEHKVIKYFWNVVSKMGANQKMKLLKFVTGSQRLPIFGFKNLQTNRGQTSCFVIQPIKYDKKKTPFPKAHTCFNRLVLPLYPTQALLQEGLMTIVKAQFQGVWGME